MKLWMTKDRRGPDDFGFYFISGLKPKSGCVRGTVPPRAGVYPTPGEFAWLPDTCGMFITKAFGSGLPAPYVPVRVEMMCRFLPGKWPSLVPGEEGIVVAQEVDAPPVAMAGEILRGGLTS